MQRHLSLVKDGFITLQEAAKLLGVSEQELKKYIKSDNFKTRK